MQTLSQILTADPVATGFVIFIAVLAIIFLLWECAVCLGESKQPACPRCGSRWHTDCDEP